MRTAVSGDIAQLGERVVRNDEVVSSILTISTKTTQIKQVAASPRMRLLFFAAVNR